MKKAFLLCKVFVSVSAFPTFMISFINIVYMELTTLPVVLNKDLTRVSDDKLQLTSLTDLEHLRSVAQNRQTWRKLTTIIREAAEASPSDD